MRLFIYFDFLKRRGIAFCWQNTIDDLRVFSSVYSGFLPRITFQVAEENTGAVKDHILSEGVSFLQLVGWMTS